ncbi:MAG: DNA-formamidopyrimidine glycosylase family protein [Acidimicrobiia bacterium]
MPELIEIESYRRLAQDNALGRGVVAVDAPDPWYLKEATSAAGLGEALRGRCFTAARRTGKLLVLDTDGGAGPSLGLRFGMTGVLVVDDDRGVDALEYSSSRLLPAWNRFTIGFADGGHLRVNDPRRLGGVVLAPDEARLGIDAGAVTPAQLARLLGDSRAPLKARLMDQGRLAGLGNLLTDEVLWRAGLDPARPAGSLTGAERRRLHRHLAATVAELGERGGSHTGDLHVARARGGRCPRDGTVLERRTIGGRTTYSCPRHQR